MIKTVIILVCVLLAVIVLGSSMVVTNEDEYTLVKQFGKVDHIIDEAGVSFKVPFIQTTSTLPKKLLYYDLEPSDVITSEKETMVVDAYVLWRIENPLKFVQTLNSQIPNAQSRINTTVYNAMKNEISKLSKNDVISGRDGSLNESIFNAIGTTMDQYGISFSSIEIKRLDLPEENKSAVYERMISERNNIAASYKASGEAEAKKIRTETDKSVTITLSEAKAKAEKLIAEGEAEYMQILSEAYNDQDKADFYTFVLALDALKESFASGDKTIILSEDSPIAEIFYQVE
ncbi:MAG: protease modulator HflC [Lachnospiraceae bacterium]|nr:protease modulator HflC [Lachnospiraceae bacterium]